MQALTPPRPAPPPPAPAPAGPEPASELAMRELAALSHAATELAQIRDEATLLARVPVLLTETLDMRRASMLKERPDGVLSIVGIAWRGAPEGALERMMTAVRADRVTSPPHFRRAFSEDRTVFVPEPDADPEWNMFDGGLGVIGHHAWLITPVRCNGRPAALLMGNVDLAERSMNAQDIARVETFARMVGLALEQVRLYASLNDRVAERTRELSDALATLQRTQGQLVQSQKLASLTQLAAGLAHEMNTPLGAMGANGDVLGRVLDRLEGNADPAALPQLLGVARGAIASNVGALERVSAIVAGLRGFANLDRAERDQVQLSASLDAALALVAHRLGDGVSVVREDRLDAPVTCRPAQINQLLYNLLTNAADALAGRGTLHLSLAREGDTARIEIADDGPGIDAEARARLFDPGYTTKGVGVGTGLGLSTCYRIAEDHGGRIEVQSEPGEGARFRVYLPLEPR